MLGQGPATAGFGQYWIDAGDATTIYNGESVYSAVGSILGAQGSATAVTLGVLQGIFYNAATTIKPNPAPFLLAIVLLLLSTEVDG